MNVETFNRRGFRITQTTTAVPPNADRILARVVWTWRSVVDGEAGPRLLEVGAPTDPRTGRADVESAVLALCDAFDKINQTSEEPPPAALLDPVGELVPMPDGMNVAGLDPWVFFAGSALQALIPLAGMYGKGKENQKPEEWAAEQAERFANALYYRWFNPNRPGAKKAGENLDVPPAPPDAFDPTDPHGLNKLRANLNADKFPPAPPDAEEWRRHF